MEQFVQLTLEEYDKLKNNEYFKEEITYLNRQLDNLKAKYDSIVKDRTSLFLETTIRRTWGGEVIIEGVTIAKYQIINIPEIDDVTKQICDAGENWRSTFKKKLKKIF